MSRTLFLLLFLTAACAPMTRLPAYAPDTAQVRLWREETATVPPGWKFLTTLTVSVRGAIWNGGLDPLDEVSSVIFTRDTTDGPAMLVMSTATKTGGNIIFRYLGGDKLSLDNRLYREAIYGLESETGDGEYARYLEALRSAGLSPAATYRVRVLDRLPVDTALIRIMECTPGTASVPLPPFAELYPQEHLEPFLNVRF